MANNHYLPNDTHRYPNHFDKWNRAHVGAYKKGAKAFHDGKPLSSNPYSDKRKPSGLLSWSRSFINAWRDGWIDAKNQSK